jgi:dienelactone hydrolase
MRMSHARGSRRSVLTAAMLGLVSACSEKATPSRFVPPESPPPPSPSPSTAFALGVRELKLSRGADRPLRTLVWYPTVGTPGSAAKLDATPLAGRYPLLLFSHGLHGTPEGYQIVTARIAAAGFVVAAPAYPYTNGNTKAFSINDMPNQPVDASHVISEVLKLDLAASIDPERIGAGGHSAGGYTTAGMLSGKTRDKRLKSGIVIAGGQLNGNFTGPAAALLFIHGDKDPTVAYSTGRAAYDKVPWSKAFLTMIGADHGSYLFGLGNTGAVAMTTMLDFLRFTLYGDEEAKRRLPSGGSVAGAARFESTL